MRLSPRALFAFVGLLSAAACAAHQSALPGVVAAPDRVYATPPPHAVIPLHVNRADKAGLNLVLNVAGGSANPFLFDTGSAGLWVYFNAFGPRSNYVSTGVRATNKYSSGIEYEGTVVDTEVAFQGGLKAARVPVVLVDVARCSTKGCPADVSAQNCPNVFKNPPKQHAAIYCLEEGRGLWGTFGADLEPTVVATPSPPVVLFNPLFGIARWAYTFIVTPHELEIGPNALAVANFTELSMTPKTLPTTLPFGMRGWKRDVTLCYTIGNFVSHACIPTLFDTGAHDIKFETAAPFAIPTQPAGCGYVLRGRAFALTAAGGALVASFQTGYSTNYNAIHLATPKPKSTPEVNTGLTFYNRDEILFDARFGVVGLHPLASPGRIGRFGCGSG